MVWPPAPVPVRLREEQSVPWQEEMVGVWLDAGRMHPVLWHVRAG